jgi:hypothetical protein
VGRDSLVKAGCIHGYLLAIDYFRMREDWILLPAQSGNIINASVPYNAISMSTTAQFK